MRTDPFPFSIYLGTGGYPTIKVGDTSTGNGKMDVDVSIDSKFAGMADTTQLVQAEFFGGISYRSTSDQYWLDNQEMYIGDGLGGPHFQIFTSIPSVVNVNDQPENICVSSPAGFHLKFHDYVRFRPDAGNPDENIFVTLGMWSWSADAVAQFDGTVWYKTVESIPVPDHPDDRENFPYWEHTSHNL